MLVSRMAARVAGSLMLVLAVGSVVVGSSAAGKPGMLWASPSGSGAVCTAPSPCSLAYAVANAPTGATVRALGGTYSGGVVIARPLQLLGQDNAVLDASSSSNGVGIQITASGSSVSQFTVENATDEGILVGNSSADSSGSPVSEVTLDHVTVTNNDTGFNGGPGLGLGECFTSTAPHAAPGDCGEGIHLNSVTNSLVDHSYVADNAGGILLTDEFGPTSGNVIQHNTVVNNTNDCGITLASHNKPVQGPPSSFGIFGNTVQFNTVDGNGVAGQAAGS